MKTKDSICAGCAIYLDVETARAIARSHEKEDDWDIWTDKTANVAGFERFLRQHKESKHD